MMTTELNMNGYKLVVSAISPLAPKAIEVQYRKDNPEPKAPTYKVDTLIEGVIEEFEHTDETVETEEEKQALLKYREVLEDWQTGLTQRILKLFFAQGVTLVLEEEQRKKLAEQLEVLQINVPENNTERDVLYLEMFVISTGDDMKKIIETVLAETGIKEDALEAANALFPDSVE